MTAWAFGTLTAVRLGGGALSDTLVIAASRTAASMTGGHVATLLAALPRLGLSATPDNHDIFTPLRKKLVRAAARLLPSMSGGEASNTIWGLSQLRIQVCNGACCCRRQGCCGHVDRVFVRDLQLLVSDQIPSL